MDELERATAELKKARKQWERAVRNAKGSLREVAEKAECSYEQVRIIRNK